MIKKKKKSELCDLNPINIRLNRVTCLQHQHDLIRNQKLLGEDEKYKASELDSHGPSVRGWLSSRNCTYPQEILFILHNTAILHQIQVLAHHYIIREYTYISIL